MVVLRNLFASRKIRVEIREPSEPADKPHICPLIGRRGWLCYTAEPCIRGGYGHDPSAAYEAWGRAVETGVTHVEIKRA